MIISKFDLTEVIIERRNVKEGKERENTVTE